MSLEKEYSSLANKPIRISRRKVDFEMETEGLARDMFALSLRNCRPILHCAEKQSQPMFMNWCEKQSFGVQGVRGINFSKQNEVKYLQWDSPFPETTNIRAVTLDLRSLWDDYRKLQKNSSKKIQASVFGLTGSSDSGYTQFLKGLGMSNIFLVNFFSTPQAQLLPSFSPDIFAPCWLQNENFLSVSPLIDQFFFRQKHRRRWKRWNLPRLWNNNLSSWINKVPNFIHFLLSILPFFVHSFFIVSSNRGWRKNIKRRLKVSFSFLLWLLCCCMKLTKFSEKLCN